MGNFLFSGSLTALITPFSNGKIDQRAFQDFVAWQIREGTEGLVPCGTTGESPTLTDEEYGLLTKLTLEVADGKVPVLAGCGGNNTAHAIHLTQQAQKAGATGALHVMPYYNKPSQEGLYQHYKAIHDASDIPIVIYNIPGRASVDMKVETMARLAELPRIIGVKDATGDLGRPVKTARLCGDNFIQLSGNDDTVLAMLAQGGVGCISVVSNIVPSLCAQMHAAWQEGDIKRAQELNKKLQPLAEILFIETSPGPVKCAAHLMGKCKNEFRLPMVPVNRETEKRVSAVLESLFAEEKQAA